MGKGTGLALESWRVQLGTQQLLCYLPQRKSSSCFVFHVSAREASRRKQSPRLNALPSAVAREQEKQVGSIYFTHRRAEKWLKLGSEGCAPEPPGCSRGGVGSRPMVQRSHLSHSSLPSRAKDLKSRLGILLHKPELGHKTGSSSKLQLGSRRR